MKFAAIVLSFPLAIRVLTAIKDFALLGRYIRIYVNIVTIAGHAVIARSILTFSALERWPLLAGVLFALLGQTAQAGPSAKALWFPDQPNTPRYTWSDSPCESCQKLLPAQGWQMMAALAGVPDIRFLTTAGEEHGSAYSQAPNVIVLAPSALKLDSCQLAFVVGHEIAHIAQRHFDEDARLLGAMTGRPVNWTRNGEQAMSLLEDNIALALRLSQHWQQQEREADWLGALLSAEVYGCTLEEGGLPYLRAAKGFGGGIGAAHDPSAVRLRLLKAFAESARRLAFQAYYPDR